MEIKEKYEVQAKCGQQFKVVGAVKEKRISAKSGYC